MDLQLSDKIALVSGSSRGTGATIAKCLANEGACVFVHGLKEGDGQYVFADIESRGHKAHHVFGDIRTDSGAEDLARQVTQTGKNIDILVNNYGAASQGSWTTSETADWIADYETNVLSSIRLSKIVTSQMKKRHWGRIIQIGTIGSTRPNAKMPGYYAAKAALAATTVSLAKELKGTGITINTVSPGLIRTPEVEAHFLAMGKKRGWGETWDEIEPHVVKAFMDNPTDQMARREDIANLVTFLASPLSAHINGQNIRIDGGAVDIV